MRKLTAVLLSSVLCFGILAGCTQNASAPGSQTSSASSANETTSSGPESSAAPGSSSQPSAFSGIPETAESIPQSGETIRLAGLKGPTTMGMAKLLADNDTGLSKNKYSFTMAGAADEIVAGLAKGELDAAAIPANLASVLYNNTEGKISLAAINTLGVLYIVETGDIIHSLEDLRGKTLYSTGQGTTPEFALNFVLQQNGIDPATDLNIEYKSEATEVAALMQAASGPAVALLPEPFVTTAKAKNEKLRTALSLTEEWERTGSGSALVTGVLVVRNDFLAEYEAAFQTFLEEYRASTEYINENPEEAALLIEGLGIAPAAVAEKAIPACNITYLAGAEMKEKVSGYLQALFEQNPKSVGGALPDDAFYYQS
ncbi:MAG: ABC transporter substrate-binding protein [Provencibacterium sp.]|nr:ABC transporter substrate-binding protein [Provencibacterium sp.]